MKPLLLLFSLEFEMKIPKSLRDAYEAELELYTVLRQRVDIYINANKKDIWHYVSRLKDLESFALKMETGRVPQSNKCEDLFACTIVVENINSMELAEKQICKRFKFEYRRPERDTKTFKRSDSFPFDDTRVYVSWKDSPLSKTSGLNGIIFEVQIKTFLAHAWSIATHDLVYKADEKSWPKERIAYQIKAMLEHAEVSIREANRLSSSRPLKKSDELTDRIALIIEMIRDLWQPEALPKNTKRLAENIDQLIRAISIDTGRLREILDSETQEGRGTKILNLSPYLSIVQALLNQEPVKMKNYLSGRAKTFKIYLPDEVEIPTGFDVTRFTNAVKEPRC
jgi:ppGpp synthetase/RelA/SpoT-type nucleotidyltranferase